jgi:hypothetical protein
MSCHENAREENENSKCVINDSILGMGAQQQEDRANLP